MGTVQIAPTSTAATQYAVMNLAAGPGEGIDLDAAQHRALLAARGIPVLGYVRVARGLRTFADVSSDALLWRNVYDVDGIFWDEAPNAMAHIELLRALRMFACQLRNGGGHCMFNPGAAVPDALLQLLPDSTWLTPEAATPNAVSGPALRVEQWAHRERRWVVLERTSQRLSAHSADELSTLAPELGLTLGHDELTQAYDIVDIRPAASLVND